MGVVVSLLFPLGPGLRPRLLSLDLFLHAALLGLAFEQGKPIRGAKFHVWSPDPLKVKRATVQRTQPARSVNASLVQQA